MDYAIAMEILENIDNLSDIKCCHGFCQDTVVHFEKIFELATLTILHDEIESFWISEGGTELNNARMV